MFLLWLLSCGSSESNEPPAPAENKVVEQVYRFHDTEVCVAIHEDSPAFPHRLVFLYRASASGVDAQVELFAKDDTRERCGRLNLRLPTMSGDTFTFDFMPNANAPKLEDNLRIYRSPRLSPAPAAVGHAEPGLDVYVAPIASAAFD